MLKIYSDLNPGEIKLLLLSQGVNIDKTLLDHIGVNDKISVNNYYYNISNDEDLCSKYNIPSEILLPDDVESSIYINFRSPLSIKYDGGYKLYLDNNLLSDIDFNKKPSFFDYKLSNGDLCSKYTSMYGRYILGLFLNGACYYVNKCKSCKFCSIGPSRKGLGARNVLSIQEDKLKEVLDIVNSVESSRVKYVMYTAGSYANLDRGIEYQAKLIKIVHDNLSSIDIRQHHLTTMPPKDYKKLKILKTAGLDSIAYDLELFNENLFKYYCPGKQEFFGYSNFLPAVENALKIFGKNNVKVGFVGGLEPVESLQEGMELFASRGASIAINVFHPDPKTPLGNYTRPTVDYLKAMVKAQRDVYNKYNIEPVFPVGGRRSSLDTEIYKGFFDHY